MKIEKVTIKRKQLVFSDSEFRDINNARGWLVNSLQFTRNNNLRRAVDALEDILRNIDIQDNGNYYILNEEVQKDDA